MKKILAIITIPLITLFSACLNNNRNNEKIIVFHAGSLSKPFHEIANLYEKENPGIDILLEAAGSRQCARKITDLKKECDIMASADYTVIEDLLMPVYTKWYLNFARNEMCIAYTDKSRESKSINEKNWMKILLSDNIRYGRSDPNTDPCGYRTVLVLKLAGYYYDMPQLADSLLAKDKTYIRPKEVDLLSLLEAHAIDYLFIYKSVAEQHNLNYLKLPDSVNLGYTDFRNYYKKATVAVSGKKPGEHIIKSGEPMIYALTILPNAPEKELAVDFVKFILDPEKGIKIMEQNGQGSVVPVINNYYNYIPDQLKKFAKPNSLPK